MRLVGCLMLMLLAACRVLAGLPAATTTSRVGPALVAVAQAGSDDARSLRERLAARRITPLPPVPRLEPALVNLGRLLFHDKILSGPRNIACASCHHTDQFTVDGLPTGIGRGGTGRGPARKGDLVLPRNTPALFNLWLPEARRLFWDGHTSFDEKEGGFITRSNTGPIMNREFRSALEAQVVGPMIQNYEMRGQNQQPGNEIARGCTGRPERCMELLMERLVGSASGSAQGIPEYRELFAKAFPGESPGKLGYVHLARAIAAFETVAFTSTGSPFDRFLDGDDSALTPVQKDGLEIFLTKGLCITCHDGPLLSDFEFHAIAVPQVGPGVLGAAADRQNDRGRFEVTDDPADLYRFRTPPLRNVALTGPWMHDGAFASLRTAMVHHLDPAGQLSAYDPKHLPKPWDHPKRPDLDGKRREQLDRSLAEPVRLTDAELAALMEFLQKGLTDPKPVSAAARPPAKVPSGLPVED